MVSRKPVADPHVAPGADDELVTGTCLLRRGPQEGLAALVLETCPAEGAEARRVVPGLGDGVALEAEPMGTAPKPEIAELLSSLEPPGALDEAPVMRREPARAKGGHLGRVPEAPVQHTGRLGGLGEVLGRVPAARRAASGESIGLTSSCGPQRAWWTTPSKRSGCATATARAPTMSAAPRT